MGNRRTSLAARTLIQVDCAFWTIHGHLEAMATLALPTFCAMAALALALIAVSRNYEFQGGLAVVVGAVLLPWTALLLFTVLPLPGAVFVWRLAAGEMPTVRQSFAACWARRKRLASVVVRMSLLWLVSLLFLGIPLLIVWPRTCLAPLVALFEDQRDTFGRSRRILRQNVAVYLLGGLFLGLALVLGGLVAAPRLILGTSAVGVHLLDDRWRELIVNKLWIFETLSAAVIITALAMGWWLSLTLLYYEIRNEREGEDLRQQIAALRGKMVSEARTVP